MKETPRIVDLFCGCGGFSLGAHAAGMRTSVAIDVDPILSSSFAANFPKTRLVHADLARVGGKEIRREAAGKIHGVFGGPPCQAFSEIGLRNARDPRRNLLRHFFRLVSEIKPLFFVMENVRGLGFEAANRTLRQSLALVPGRYKIVGPMILDAADFGAATRRPRLFIVGYDPRYCDPISLASFESKRKHPNTVRAAISDLSHSEMIGEVEGFDMWKSRRPGRRSGYAANLRAADGTFTGHRSTAHTRSVIRRFAQVRPGEVDRVGRHPRLDWDGQCPTLRAGTGWDHGRYQSVRPIHPEEPRVISVREAARLQGFPDKFRFHPTVWHSFRMIGNSVSPIMSEAIFSAIAERVEV